MLTSAYSYLQRDDLMILSMLMRDARSTYEYIGTQLRLSRQTVSARVRKMETSGIIKGYRVSVDYQRIGFTSFFVLFLKLGEFDPQMLQRALTEIKNDPHVMMDVSITGEWDIMQILAFRTTEEYDKYIEKLRGKYGRIFRDMKTHAILKFFKHPDEYSLY
jgi:Lrp/AsnC family leucine-responsive transcriptional regulator